MPTSSFRLSSVDKKILKFLLVPDGEKKFYIANKNIDKKIADRLRISQSLVTERRIQLEKDFLKIIYIINLIKLGHRRVDFFISTKKGLTLEIAKKLLKMKNSVSIGRSIGEPTIDLRAEFIVKDNGMILELLESIKGMNGVRDAVWSEIVEVVGNNGSFPVSIIDVL